MSPWEGKRNKKEKNKKNKPQILSKELLNAIRGNELCVNAEIFSTPNQG